MGTYAVKKRVTPTSMLGKPIGPVGYGMLGLTIPWDLVEPDEAITLLHTALENGANFWNGSLHYGTPTHNSLHLLAQYFTLHPSHASRVTLSIKGAYNAQTGPDGTPEGIRASVNEALRILDGKKKIDVFELARVDPNVPIETSIRTLGELVQEGKIGGVAVSEVSAATLRRAHAVWPVSVAEVEVSLFTPEGVREGGVVDVCHELGIVVVSYSPVGRGWLTGQIKSLDDLPKNDFRRKSPRFAEENFKQNCRLVEAVERIAARKGVTTAQVALAWVAYHGAIPIPGSKKPERIAENCTLIELSEEEMGELQAIIDTNPVAGTRYPAAHLKYLNA